jgi:fructose-1-phosphate kinase PfkB-like protein
LKRCYSAKNAIDLPELLVVSGSISEGLPVDFYKQIAEIAKRQTLKLWLIQQVKL